MRLHAPTATMNTISRIERIQPTVAGVGAQGELIWEGRAMARWQMEMFRTTVDWFGSFFSRWIEMTKYESSQEEFNERDGAIMQWLAMSKTRLNEYKMAYPKPRRAKRTGAGD